jgi:hypothetical protein
MAHDMPVKAMSWQPLQEEHYSNGSRCVFTFAEGLEESTMTVHEEAEGLGWIWEVKLWASDRRQVAYGFGCATESKARHMAMHFVAAMLQIMDGLKPFQVD